MLRIPCECGGHAGCPHCKGDRRGVAINHCPYDEITPDVSEFVQMVDYAAAGTLPVMAGARDQAYAFMTGRDFFNTRLHEARQYRADSERTDGEV